MEHADEVMTLCVDAYMCHVRGMRVAIEDMEMEIADHEQSLALMGVDYSRSGGGKPTSDKLPDGIAKLLALRDRLAEQHARCSMEIAYARQLCRGNEDLRALWMHEVDRSTYSEVGRVLGCSAMTARRRVGQGRRLMYMMMPEQWRRDAIPNAMPR